MRLWDFLKDKCLLIVLQIVCMCLLSLFLQLTGYGQSNIMLILIFWAIILGVWLAVTYIQRRSYFRKIEQILDNLDKRYLLGELLPFSWRLEDRLYRDMIYRSGKAVVERIRQVEDTRRDYKEYIENWVHEIKAPITAISLLCENGRRSCSGAAAKEAWASVCLENQKIENYVDLVLYYARSEQVYRDFMIQKTNLQELAEDVLEKNRLLLIRCSVRAEVDCKDMVYTDRKWIAFILNQMILNSVKYCSSRPEFLIVTRRERDGVILTFKDNGIGIASEELPRIFDKGFTGSNGRKRERSTGMGLYLCRKLCERLGISITAHSQPGRGTTMLLTFPVSNYISRQEDETGQSCKNERKP